MTTLTPPPLRLYLTDSLSHLPPRLISDPPLGGHLSFVKDVLRLYYMRSKALLVHLAHIRCYCLLRLVGLYLWKLLLRILAMGLGWVE
jgi:hypothetical protein